MQLIASLPDRAGLARDNAVFSASVPAASGASACPPWSGVCPYRLPIPAAQLRTDNGGTAESAIQVRFAKIPDGGTAGIIGGGPHRGREREIVSADLPASDWHGRSSAAPTRLIKCGSAR